MCRFEVEAHFSAKFLSYSSFPFTLKFIKTRLEETMLEEQERYFMKNHMKAIEALRERLRLHNNQKQLKEVKEELEETHEGNR